MSAVAGAFGVVWFAARVLGRTRGSQVMTIGLAVFLVDRGLFVAAIAVGVVAVELVVVPLLDDGTDEVHVGLQVRLSARAWHRYGRQWPSAMYAVGLGHPWDQGVPYLLRVRRVAGGDVLALQTLPGQPVEDIGRAVPELARVLGAARGFVRSVGPGAVWIELVREPAEEESDDPGDTASLGAPAVVVGVAEDGAPWAASLRTHVLVAGDAGTGTTSVLRAIARSCGPHVHEGRLSLRAIDTGGGGRLTAGGTSRPAEVAFGARDAAVLLDGLRREVRLRAGARRAAPTPDAPLVVLLIDDLSTLLAGAALEVDVRCRQLPRILHTVLSEGGAVGVVVVAVVKHRDERLRAWRHLFGTRVALRLADPAATDDVLGDGARRLGAACDRIPPPPVGTGVAWAWSPTAPAPVRIAVEAHPPHARSA